MIRRDNERFKKFLCPQRKMRKETERIRSAGEVAMLRSSILFKIFYQVAPATYLHAEGTADPFSFLWRSWIVCNFALMHASVIPCWLHKRLTSPVRPIGEYSNIRQAAELMHR